MESQEDWECMITRHCQEIKAIVTASDVLRARLVCRSWGQAFARAVEAVAVVSSGHCCLDLGDSAVATTAFAGAKSAIISQNTTASIDSQTCLAEACSQLRQQLALEAVCFICIPVPVRKLQLEDTATLNAASKRIWQMNLESCVLPLAATLVRLHIDIQDTQATPPPQQLSAITALARLQDFKLCCAEIKVQHIATICELSGLRYLSLQDQGRSTWAQHVITAQQAAAHDTLTSPTTSTQASTSQAVPDLAQPLWLSNLVTFKLNTGGPAIGIPWLTCIASLQTLDLAYAADSPLTSIQHLSSTLTSLSLRISTPILADPEWQALQSLINLTELSINFWSPDQRVRGSQCVQFPQDLCLPQLRTLKLSLKAPAHMAQLTSLTGLLTLHLAFEDDPEKILSCGYAAQAQVQSKVEADAGSVSSDQGAVAVPAAGGPHSAAGLLMGQLAEAAGTKHEAPAKQPSDPAVASSTATCAHTGDEGGESRALQLWAPLLGMRRLRELNVRKSWTLPLSDAVVEALVSSWPQLEVLQFSGHMAALTDRGVGALAGLPNLQVLALGCLMAAPQLRLALLPRHLQCLSVLGIDLVAQGAAGDGSGGDAGGLPPRLRMLSIKFCRWCNSSAEEGSKDTSTSSMLRAISGCPHLLDLRLAFAQWPQQELATANDAAAAATAGSWAKLASMQQLERLDIVFLPDELVAPGHVPQQYAELVREVVQLRHLQHLKLRVWGTGWDAEAPWAALARLRYLKSLELQQLSSTACWLIQQQVLPRMPRCRVRLEVDAVDWAHELMVGDLEQMNLDDLDDLDPNELPDPDSDDMAALAELEQQLAQEAGLEGDAGLDGGGDGGEDGADAADGNIEEDVLV